TYREHVGVRPMSRSGVSAPCLGALKHIVKKIPSVPEIVGYPPHVGVLLQKLRLRKLCGSGRKTQDHIPAAVLDGGRYKLYLALVPVVAADVVYLDKVNSPLGVQLENAVVVVPCALAVCVSAVHIRIPPADVVIYGYLPCRELAVKDFSVHRSRLAGNAS